MKALTLAAVCGVALIASPLLAQDDSGGEVIVTASRIQNSLSSAPGLLATIDSSRPPVIGLKRQADSAVRTIEIVSDSRDEAVRKREVQAMLLDAIDGAKRQGVFLVTGQFELVEVTRDNWKDQFPGLAEKSAKESDDDDDYEDDEEDDSVASFEDDGSNATVRLKVKTKLDGSIGNAQQKISSYAKGVPVTGRSQIVQKGGLALTIINPEQYRDKVYELIAKGSKHAVSFYGPEYGLNIVGLDQALAWNQVSNTEVFLYIPYRFTVEK
jgi:hypothetical protein